MPHPISALDLPLDAIVRNPDQPRRHFDPDALRELAASIAAVGLMQPITVRRIEDDPARFVIVAGERRWRAHQLAGLPRIAAQVVDADEVEAYVLSVAENVNRLDMTVLEESDAYTRLVGYGKSVEDIARLFGKSETYITIRLSFEQLVDEARALLSRGEIGPNLARWVADLRPGNQRTVINRWARGEFRHESEAAEFARNLRGSETEEGFFELETPTVEQRETHKVKSAAARRSLDRVDALGTLLADIARHDAAELAHLLGGELVARHEQLDRIANHAQAAKRALARARVHVSAREVTVRTEVQA